MNSLKTLKTINICILFLLLIGMHSIAANGSTTVESGGSHIPGGNDYTIAPVTNLSCTKTITGPAMAADGNIGSIALGVSGGTAPYSYLWSSGETTANISAKPVGSYTVTINDAVSTPPLTIELGIGYKMFWKDLRGVEVQGNDLVKTVSGAAFNGASSLNSLAASTDGWMEYTVTSAGGERFLSFSNYTGGDITTTLKGCVFGFDLAGSTIYKLENDVFTVIPGKSAYVGDIFRLERVGNTFNLKLNGVVISTKTAVSDELYIRSGIYNPGHKLETVRASFASLYTAKLSYTRTVTELGLASSANIGTATIGVNGGVAPYSYVWSSGETTASITSKPAGSYTVTVNDANNAQPVTMSMGIGYKMFWKDFKGTEAQGNDLVKTASGTTYSGASSMNRLAANTDGWLEYSVTTAIGDRVVGFSNYAGADITSALVGFNYGFDLYQGTIYKMENNSAALIPNVIIYPGDIIRLERVGSTFNIKVNGVVIHTKAAISDELYVRTTISTTGHKWDALRASFGATYTAKLSYTTAVTELGLASSANIGTASIGITGGAAPYSYAWSSGETTASITSKPAGSYTVTVNDANNAQPVTMSMGIGYKMFWKDFKGTEVQGNNLVKTASGNAYSGASSMNRLAANTDGWLEYSVTTAIGDRVVGFSNYAGADITSALVGFNYGFDLYQGTIYKMENNSAALIPNVYIYPGDIIRLERVGSTFNIKVNGVVIHTKAAISDELYVRSTISTTGHKWDALRASFPATYTTKLNYTTAITGMAVASDGNIGTGAIGITGGVAPYTYLWSSGETTANITGKAAGSYTVTVNDANNAQPLSVQLGIGYKTYWKDFKGTEAQGTDLVKTATPNGYNGASTMNRLAANTDGWIEYSVTTTNDRFVSFSNYAGADIYSTVKGCTYGFDIYGTSIWKIENDVMTVLPNVYVYVGDILRVERVGNTFNLKLNGVVIHTKTAISDELYVRAGIYNTGIKWDALRVSFPATYTAKLTYTAAITNIATPYEGNTGAVALNISSGTAPYSYSWSSGETTANLSGKAVGSYTVTVNDALNALPLTVEMGIGYKTNWKDFKGAEAQGNDLVKTGTTNAWNGASSSNRLAANTNGWMEYTVVTTSGDRLVGFSNYAGADVTTANKGFNYGFDLYQGTIYKIENDAMSLLVNVNVYPGDIIRLERVGSTFNIKLNGVVIHTKTAISNELYTRAAIYNTGLKLEALRVSFPDMDTPFPNQRFWIGNGSNKNWNNTANWAAVSGGAPGASVPSADDAVYFNNGGVGELILDANIDVKMFNILSSYTGSIQQNGKTITVGTNGMVVSGGTFLGDNADITVNGPFTLTGGSFRSTSTKLTIAGNYSDGTTTGFIHNSGKVYFPTSKTISGKTNFYNLQLNPSAAATYTVLDTVTVNDSLVYRGTGAITLQTGTINAKGHIAITNTGVTPNGSGTGWIHICGTGNQTFTGNQNSDPNSFAGAVGNTKINKASGTLTLDKNITLIYANVGGDHYWQYVRGTVDAGTSLVTFIGTKGHITSVNGSNSMSFNNLRIYSGETHLSTDVTILGNLIQDGTFNTQAHTINLKGNFVNSGEFRYEGSTVSFTGTSNQYVTGSIPYSVFNKVVVNKPSGKLYLNYHILVITDLALQKGVVVGSAANYVEIYNEGTLTGGSKESYVNGAINKICNFNTDFIYALGDTTATDSVYHPFRVALPGGGYAFKAQYVAKNVLTDHPTFTAKDGSLSSLSSCEYWSIIRTVGPAIGILPTLSLKSNTCTIPLTDMRVTGWDGSQWKNMGQGSLTGTAISGTVQALAPALTNETQYYTLATFSSFNRYWIGSNANKDWNNTANWSLTSGGSGGAAVPTATDAVYFDAGGTGDLILESNVDVKMFNILSSYTGTIQQNGKTITIGTDGMVVNGGTFSGDNADITVNGSFTLTGGSFRSTSTKLTIAGNYSDGTTTGFIHNSGKVYFPTSKTISGRTNFYDLNLNPSAAATYTVLDTVTVNDSLVYSGAGAITLQTGTINAKGNIAITHTGVTPNGSGTGWIHICGTGNQTFTGNQNSDPNSFAGAVGNTKINKASGTLTLDKNITLIYANVGGDHYWQYVRGTVNAGTSLVTFIGTKGHITSVNGSNSMSFNNLRIYSGETHLSTDVTILGNLIQDGTFNTQAHTINLKGNFVNSGEFRYEGSTVSFTGTSNQYVTGSIPYSVFNKVVVNKPSGKLYLNYHILVITDLALQKGVVVGSAANYIEIYGEGTITGGSKQSYVNGAINKICNFNTNFTYALGDTTASDSSAYHPFRTMIPGGGYAFKAQYFTKNILTDHPTFTAKAGTLNSISSCEYWSLTRTAGPTTILPVLGWNTNSCNIHAFADVHVASWNGTQWDDLGQSAIIGNSDIGRVTAANAGPDLVDQYYVIAEAQSTTPIASFFATNAHSLPPAVEWSKTFGGNDYDDVRSVIATKDGGYMFLGNTYSTTSGDMTGTNRGYSDYWAVKLDGSGNLLWNKNLGSVGFDSPYGMSEDTDGGCLIVGQAGSSSGDFSGLLGSGPNDIVIVKLDAAGNVGWLKLLGGNSGDLGTSIKRLSNGYLVTGLSQSATGDIHDANNGDVDGVIIKLDNSRNIQWLKVIGTSGFDFVSDFVELPTGDIVAVGAKTMTTNGEDYFIIKLSSTGNVIWEKTYGGTGEDDANNIAITNGGFIVTGYSYSIDGDVTDAATGPNVWTIKIDDAGNLVWKKTVGGNGEEKGNGVVSSPEGGSVVAGYTSSNDHGLTSNTTAQGDRDNLLVKFKSNGDVEWVKSFGDGMNERIYGFASTPDGGYFAGSIYQTKNGTEVSTGRGTGDALVTKLKEPVIIACLNSSITFSNTSINATSYLWKVNNVSAGTSADLTYVFNTAGTYTVSLTANNGGQTHTKNSIVTISGGVTADAGPAVATSAGSGVTIGGTPAATGGIAPYTYLWNPGTALSSTTIANPISTAIATTTYTLMVADAAGCSSSASVVVTVEEIKSYAELKKAVDAGYYQVNTADHTLYFNYTEEYKSGNLIFKIYDNTHELKSCPTVLPKQYGDNRFGIDLMGCLGASSSKYYLLEVINDKSEKLLLKFKY